MQPFTSFWSLFHMLFLTLISSWGHSHLPLMVAGFRSVCGEGSSASEPPCLLDSPWNNACTFAKDISWAVCMCEEKKQTLVCFPVCEQPNFSIISTLQYSTFYLDVLTVLSLQQALVIGFNAKCEVRTGNYVSPIAPDSHFVPFLSRHKDMVFNALLPCHCLCR